MATREVRTPGASSFVLLIHTFIVLLTYSAHAQVLTPPSFNLAQGRNVSATATCGVGVVGPELFCRLTGATSDRFAGEVVQGQLCDYCYPELPQQDHRPEFATDGTERWWQSPPLSRGMQYNAVNFTIHLGQMFHVAYVFIKMANSPRPGVWVLERSTDFGRTWDVWQYFADTPSDCNKFFSTAADAELVRDDQVLCTTEFSKVVPLEGGEVVVSLVIGRPGAEDFSNNDLLQEWTKATDVQLRMIRTKTLLGHLMAVARQDPTVTRRYYYSIKDISIGGRCVCNGHAETCDRPAEVDELQLVCACVHNTCGAQCDQCCPGFVQKRWRRARANDPFECEPCQCYGHTTECVFDEEVERQMQSIDIHGNYEGGGVCQNCQHNTMGVNCEQCRPGYYHPYGVALDAVDTCKPCECDLRVSTGECEEGSGRCLCRPEYTGLDCDRCNIGYYGYPDCVPCDCHINGTEDGICTVATGTCPCKVNYAGRKCDMCAFGYYDFPECRVCDCNPIGSATTKCDLETGQCECSASYGSRDCSACADGFFNYPNCEFCNCDPAGTEDEICDKTVGSCLCKEHFTGERCDRCEAGFYGFPNCRECMCADPGSRSPICLDSGQCSCNVNFAGLNCDRCAAGYYRYPDCIPCECDLYGSLGKSCDQASGQCSCRDNFEGLKCEKCKENFYNYPMCEVCNCNPDGSKEITGLPLGGCGIVISGLLCECKERVQGRICDSCKPGYWNLNRNNPLGCEECSCNKPGTLTGSNVCNVESGQCMCKPDVGGRDCDQCRDGFYDLQDNNPFGCSNCMCNFGGSHSAVCNKLTGQCRCRPRVMGQKCDQPIQSHFYPDLHQLKFEIEDGETPEGARIRYGYDERIFPDYSWRGYAILTDIQPEVLLEVDIRTPSLYQIIYRYINRNDNPVRAEVTLTPDFQSGNVQTGQIVFLPTTGTPKFARVTTGAVTAFVLNPGRWTVSTKVPDIAFLDYFVLIPQDFYEATVLQQRITKPCSLPGDPGPCLHYQYPDLIGYPFVPGADAYIIMDNQRQSVDLYPDTNITTELGTRGLAHLNPNQLTFTMDLVVPDPGLYVLVVAYLNPTDRTQELDVDVASLSGREKAKLTLHSCKYSTLCRQVFMTQDGMIAIFNISTGYVSLTFTGPDDVDIAIDSVTAVPYDEWSTEFIRPRIICIRVNGICIPSSYSVPLGTVRVDFELPPNMGRLAVDLPPNILDKNTGLIQLNNTERDIEICGTVAKPGQYVVVIHYYMPTENALMMPVTVNINGQLVQGMFKPTYCPSVTGCRAAVMFGSNNIVNMNDISLCILVNNTSGGKIWLDYALIVPAEHFTPFDLELQPIDRSGDFLTNCVNEGFELSNDSEFCRESVFTVTTEFNKGAVQCDCNVDGSLNFNCQEFGGQCQCRPNVIGRTCTACRPGYYGFPDCQPCNCPFGVCHPITGDCICPPRVEGERCDRCQPGAYGYDALIGCQECNCNSHGVQDGDVNCDQTTGQCYCLPNVGGRKCDTCLPGHHSFPYCDPCDCDPQGTEVDICDQTTSECLCKPNVVGPRCDQCADGMFHLSNENPKGCTKCFCFGTTTRCNSSSLIWDEVNMMKGWAVSNTVDGIVIEAGSTIAVKALDNIEDTSKAVYWVASPEYLGNKIHSYGGMLSFTVLFTLPRDLPDEVQGLIEPDVILMGSNMTLVHTHPNQPVPSAPLHMDIPLFEYNFHHAETGAGVSREQFMMALISLQALHIRASYFSLVDEARLSDVSMQYATETGAGDMALTVEQCQCPPSYMGTSCQECAPGHYRYRSTPYLGICVKCNCNGHSEDCDVVTGECYNCQGNTTGPNCEQCLPGYYGDPTTGGCQICSCPHPIPSNNFATSCYPAEDGVRTYCDCLPGYYGPSCESCAPGYFGNPLEVGSYCQPCDCSGNIDARNPRSCDRFSGICQLCLNNTAGERCQVCQDWYWGDAVGRKDCQPCTCDRCGSESCDKTLGMCNCKPNIIGAQCDQCAANTWGFEYCDGCRDCECGLGSVTPQCDVRTGRCECQPGVKGTKCDLCQPGYWNLGPNGCQECDCLSDGATGCDDKTGRCICLPGVTGPQCDRCLDRWVLVPGQGCQECDYCIHLLLDDMEMLDRNVTTVRRQLADVSVGVAAFNRLGQYNATVSELQPQVADLYNLDQDELQQMLDPLIDKLDTTELSTKDTLDKANQALAQANQLSDSVMTLDTDATDIESVIRDQVTEAENAVQFVKRILQQILASIKVTNIERYIRDAELIQDNLRAMDYLAENASAIMELENAQAALMKIEELIGRVDAQMNSTIDTESVVNDILERLLDLGKNTETKTSLQALDILNRLRAQNMEDLESKLADIKMHEDEIKTLLEMSSMLLDKARGALDNATQAFLELSGDQSRMETAMQSLDGHLQGLDVTDIEPKVEQAIQHAEQLWQQADELDGLYNNTRDLSANAILAGKAYQNIIKDIDSAHNNSVEAMEDAERALNATGGNGEESRASLEKSTTLLASAEDAKDETRHVLSYEIDLAKNSTDDTAAENSKVREMLENVKLELTDLEGSSTSDLSQDVIDRSEVAKERAMQAADRIVRITDLLPDDKKKLDSIRPDRIQANLDMKNAATNMDAVRKDQPEIVDLMRPLRANATRLIGIGQGLELNVKALREKIELAREQANRIRVGLKFLGNTTVTARNPPQLDQAGSYSQLSMYFKTTQSDGLLMYVGGQQRASNLETDYMSLEVRGGRLLYQYNLGSGRAQIASNRLVNDGQWHQAVANRIGKTGTLVVRTDKEADEKQEGASQGTFTVLELNPATTGFYIGGVPDDIAIPREVTRTFLEGSVEDMKFDETPVGLWNFEDAENNRVGENARDVMKEIVTNGMRFNGMGYAVLSRKELGIRPNRTDIQLQFQTFSQHGLLVYMGDYKRDFLSIELKDGRVVFQYDLGGGRAELTSTEEFNDGKWHTVLISRRNRRGLLRIDEKPQGDGESQGTLSELSMKDDIFVGGFDQILVPSRNVGSHGFDGCIRDMQFGNIAWDLNDNQRAKGVVRGCPAKVSRVASYAENRPEGAVAVDFTSVGSMFDITFKMRTKQAEALLLYVANEAQDNVFTVGIVEGTVVVNMTHGGVPAKMSSLVNTYNDGAWHYVSIMKMGADLTMNIDDYEMLHTDLVSGEADLVTTTPLFFGNLPDGYSIKDGVAPSTARFVGCIGDITVNKRFVNLANIPEGDRLGVSLVECPMKSDSEMEEGTATTLAPDRKTPVPDETTVAPNQCALPQQPDVAPEDAEVSGLRFGTNPYTRQEYSKLPGRMRIRSVFSVEVKTTANNGLIFYVADSNHIDFMGVYMVDGQINYGFNCGSGAAKITSEKKYNDGQWHKIEFARDRKQGTLKVNNEIVGMASSRGNTRSINVNAPYFVGGIAQKVEKAAIGNVGAGSVSFPGCIRNMKMRNQEVKDPKYEDPGVQPCSSAFETGTFFPASGGYLQLYDRYKVGRDLEIEVEVRPRSTSGVLLAVHGRMDYLVLQIVDGQVIFTADNGAGAITTTFTPPAVNSLCDGNWHTIRANKNKNVVTLLVDGVQAPEPGIGSAKVSAADTNDPLFVGGVPDKGAKGVQTSENYVGCIRNLQLNDKPYYLASGQKTGEVQLDSCPVN